MTAVTATPEGPTSPGRRLTRIVAAAMAVITLSMAAFTASSLLLPGNELLPQRPDLLGVVAYLLAFGAFPCVGGIIAWRRPDHPIGWLFLVIGCCVTVGVFSTEYVYRVLLLGWALPAAGFVAWLGDWGFQLGMGIALTLVPLLFPDGHLPSPRWTWFAGLVVAVILAGTAALALAPGPVPGYSGAFGKLVALPPEAAGLTSLLVELTFPLYVVLSLACIGSLFVRFRRGEAMERAQIKWFLSASAAFLCVLVSAFALNADIAFILAVACLATIPIATGIAILRYRLFDIDRIVSRTLGWLLVTAILLSLFVGAILVAQGLLAPLTGGTTVGVAISTLLVAASFAPVRSRVQRAVDRRFNRAHYDAQRIAAGFAARLRDEVDLERVLADLSATTDGALAPAVQGLWIRDRGSR